MRFEFDVLRYLEEHNITLADAARAAGVASQNIRKSLENNPKTSTLLAIANGLQIDPRDFFYNIDDEATENVDECQNVAERGNQQLNTTAYCPHCGKKVNVGVVLIQPMP